PSFPASPTRCSSDLEIVLDLVVLVPELPLPLSRVANVIRREIPLEQPHVADARGEPQRLLRLRELGSRLMKLASRLFGLLARLLDRKSTRLNSSHVK